MTTPKVKVEGKIIEIKEKGQNILASLAEHSVFISAYCGGKGICGKCKIRYLSKPPDVTDKENLILSEREIKDGIRLACMHTFDDNDIIEAYETKPVFSDTEGDVCADRDGLYIALDIGTTTVSLSLINNKKIERTINILNPQVAFGGDVMTRIAYSNKHSLKSLSLVLNKALKESLEKLLFRYKGNKKIDEIVISANPTMLSYLLGYDPKSIGEYPYTPPFTGSKRLKWNGIDVYVPPVVSAFVGSDITSGLMNIDINEDFLFVDIGTNCEFVLKYKNRLYSASVPGGPALEGAGIDYGITAQEGAIEKVEYDKIFKCHTIGNSKAQGIAGSGLISAIALLNKYDIMEKNGKIKEPWEIEDIPLPLLNRIKKEGFLLEGNIYLTQRSIREFQLVKGALNAGVDILMKKTGCDTDNIKRVYIAGGFTKSLTKNDIIYSNLLNFDNEFIFLGNSAVKGAIKLFCKKNRERIEKISQEIEYMEIANEESFQELYIKYMDFR